MRGMSRDVKTCALPRKATVSASYKPPVLLDFSLDDAAVSAIEAASSHIAKLARSVDLRVLLFPHYGREAIKRAKYAPDYYIQMALQLAHFRLHKEFVAAYETAHTRLFYHGRTETIRSTTLEAVTFCKTMEDGTASNAEKLSSLRAAIDAHKALVKDAMTGHGIDRHLLGLRIVAEAEGKVSEPAIFTDPGLLKSSTFALSTSNVSTSGAATIIGGYAPFFPGGYGICYSLDADRLSFCISHVKGSRTDVDAMRKSIETALFDMQALCHPSKFELGVEATAVNNGAS